ncbi:glycosyl transferase [Acetobacter indonesiensis]|uniref:glycosyltransferase n=1 Tax=Acetobacter indonesiensis TaxID=104101 RepID=UPI000A3ACB64|nr:glycosyltransferase [Acetobacter indonesiensis]OUI93133.1 glycosyl transferase [Acetobacter indonesiensis]
MAIIYNTNYTHNPNAYLTLGVERAAKALLGDDQVVVADNHDLGALAAAGEHSTLICIDGQRINIPLLQRMRPAFKTMILWTFEDPFMKDFNAANAGLFDYVFTNDPSCVEAYGSKGHYLPLAASLSLHDRLIKPADQLDYDIFFAGTMWPNRVETLRHVIAAFPNARLKLICPGNEYLPPLPSDLAELAIQRPVSHEAFVDFANASAVTLTMFRDYASHGDTSQATAPGPRFYELGLAGTAQVIEAPEAMDSKYFDDVKGIALARHVGGVIAAIDSFLTNPTLRKRAAQAAKKSVLDKHLYENRLRTMMDVTGADFGRRKAPPVPTVAQRRLRVLMCTHSTKYEAAWGGVEVYQETLCSLLGREIDFYYWLRRGGHCRLITSDGEEVERFDVPEVGWTDAMCDGPEEMAFSNVLSHYNMDVVHFQHLGHHALSLPIIAKACGAGVVFSAHDFWLISSRYNLLDQSFRYDEELTKSVVAYDIILKNAENVEYGGEQTRRAFVATMLHSVDALLFGTEHSYNLISEIYPIVKQKKCAIMGIPSPESTLPVARKDYKPLDGKPLSVAIVGNFLRTKGADTILNLIEIAHPDNFHFHIFGAVHPEYKQVLADLNRPNVTVHGQYSMGNTDALKVADVALNLSIWPETYCISLSEAWQNGLLPIVTDVGALHDRVEDEVNGFKVPINSPSMVLERLELLRASEPLRKQMMANISPALWTDGAEYGRQLRDIYYEAAPFTRLGFSEMQIDAGQVHLLPHASWRHQAPPRHIFDPPTTRDLSVELPEPVSDWFAIQDAEYYIDDICHHVFAESELVDFEGAYEFHIRGWHMVPRVSASGTLYTVLIGDKNQPVIFLPCIRESRPDVLTIYPDAPRRSGFAGQVALRGKWCEGTFRVALINVINGRGSFALTPFQIQVDEGKIKHILYAQPSNLRVMADFRRVAHQDGQIRGVKLTQPGTQALQVYNAGDLEYYIDECSGLIGNPPREINKNGFYLSGWAFLHNIRAAGKLFVACVAEQSDEIFYFGTERCVRSDVSGVFSDAPLCVGFEADIVFKSGFPKILTGDYRICLVNTVNDQIGIRPLDFVVSLDGNSVKDVVNREVSPQVAEHVRTMLRATLQQTAELVSA